MGNDLRMRSAGSGDLSALSALLDAEGLPPAAPSEGNTHFRVLDDGRRIVAAAGLESHGRCALLRSVVVAPERRGQGLARRLAGHMEALAQELGHDALYLLTMDAQAVFAALGYERVARDEAPDAIRACRQFREQCPDSAVLMRKAVGGGMVAR